MYMPFFQILCITNFLLKGTAQRYSGPTQDDCVDDCQYKLSCCVDLSCYDALLRVLKVLRILLAVIRIKEACVNMICPITGSLTLPIVVLPAGINL